VPGDEDRELDWDSVVERVGRAVRRVARATGVPRIGLLGYCMGGTLTAIHTALHPESIAALVDLAGPIDFAEGGRLARMVDARWFDPQAMVAAGNLHALQMQAGFVALRPTTLVAKWVGLFDRLHDAEARDAFVHLEAWSNDNVAFPAAAYIRYIRDLYQRNELVRGEHHVRGQRVDLRRIACPLLVIVASHDHICPPAAAEALVREAASEDARVLSVPGGHIGAVVGHNARTTLYPELAMWLRSHLQDRFGTSLRGARDHT
jgi:polyhydroxyalkanoate synthase